MPAPNFNSTTPAAASGTQNIVFATDGTAGHVSATDPAMVGDTGSGGKAGNAPAPAAGAAAAGKFLKADGTWEVGPGGATGPAGPTGAMGPTGATGATGATGPAGPAPSGSGNQVLATPNGSSGVSSLRSLVSADIPTLNQNTSGTAANVTGTVAIANGGTGATSLLSAGIPSLSASNTFTTTQIVSTAGIAAIEVLTSSSTAGEAFVGVFNDLSQNANLQIRGSATSGTLAGLSLAGLAILETSSTAGLLVGTYAASPLIFMSNTTERMRILSGGNVGIGNTAPGFLFCVGSAFSVDSSGDVKCLSLDITAGSNTKTGSGTLVAGTVTISNTSVTANSMIFVTPTSSSSTTSGVLAVTTKTAGSGFTVKSSLATDVATFNYFIVETA